MVKSCIWNFYTDDTGKQLHVLVGEMFLNHAGTVPERMNMADSLTLSLRRSREERRFVLGVACSAVGIDGLNQQGLGFVGQEETPAGG